MFGKMDPKQMSSLMKQMGIKTEEIEAERVVIEKTDGSRIVVESPSVQCIDMKGQKSFQVMGSIKEEGSSGEKGKSDVDIISEECGCTHEEAEKALEEAEGDLAQAILKLKGG
ncbi:MAG: nascent polypeptide-associated complex protein [Candidatus Micrarchaeota archaeon]